MIAKKLKFGKGRQTLFQSVVISIVFVVVFGGLLSFFIYQNVKIGHRRGDLEGKLEGLRAQAGELQERKLELEENIEDTQTLDYQEKILRIQGLYKKPGEEVVTILPPEEQEVVVEEEEQKRVWWNPWTW